ncbi:MAG: hypothetical protein INF43_04805 [Alphaproteobacteria bacterium]|jgi:hypothetical protein|nr:hypothetical protein [Alphaproteobacteria bacterium]
MTWQPEREQERQRLVQEWRQDARITVYLAVATLLSPAVGMLVWFCVKWLTR